jgi:hypothetical protein
MQKVEIKVKGKIDKNWSNWLGDFNITHDFPNESTLVGFIRDQAQLRGILSKIADLGLELTSVDIKK